jgi:flagellar biosynthetic protein FliR
MGQLTLANAVKALGGTGEVTAFFLVLARVTPLFVLAPLFSSKLLPTRVRGMIAVAISIGLTPMAMHGQTIPSSPMPLAGSIVVQLLVGLAFSFAVGAVFAAVDAAGHFVDNGSGFSFGASIDPINGNAGGTFTSLYGLIGTAIFLAIGGEAWTLRGLTRTFTLVPLDKSPRLPALVGGVESAFAGIFVAALEIAAPVMLALLITDTTLGMISRVMPQLNVFAIGFPMKVGVSLLVVSVSLPFLGSWMTTQLSSSVGAALTSLHVG